MRKIILLLRRTLSSKRNIQFFQPILMVPLHELLSLPKKPRFLSSRFPDRFLKFFRFSGLDTSYRLLPSSDSFILFRYCVHWCSWMYYTDKCIECFYTPRLWRVGCNSFDIVCVCVCVCVSITTLTAKRTDIRTWISACRSSGRISRSSL